MSEDVGVEWGSGDAMDTLEAMMWRAEADPQLRSHGVILELLDSVPDWERLRAAHEWAIRRVPRLSDRVVDDPLKLGSPAWVPTEVDLDHHLRRVTLSGGATFDDALAVAEQLHMKAFDPACPLWEAVLVDGLADGQSVYLLKLHHSMADGTGVIQLLNLTHSDRRAPTPFKPVVAKQRSSSPQGAADVSARNAARQLRGTAAGALNATTGAVSASAKALRNPAGTISSAAELAASIKRVVASAPATPSPLLRTRGLDRRLGALEVPVKSLRDAGKAAGGTLNDAFLAALTGGLARYHAAHDCAIDELPIALPVSLRSADDPAGGNRFAGARIAAPVNEADPAERIRILGRRVLAAREEPALDFMSFTAPVASRLPAPLLTRLTADFTTSIDLQASNFRGLDRRSYIAGARVLRMWPFGPAPGCAMMATLVSHEGTCCIGLTIDEAAFPDAEVLTQCMREGFAEVLELVPAKRSA